MSTPPTPGSLAQVFEAARSMDAPINERLKIIADATRRFSPEYGRAVDDLAERLSAANAFENVPNVGDAMPPFMMPDNRGALVDLESLTRQGPAAIVFQRGSWCPFCRMNTIALSEAYGAARAAGGNIVAVSPDVRKFTNALREEFHVPFQLLTDIDNGYAMSLGLLIWIGDSLFSMHVRAQRNDVRFQSDAGSMLPVPATFIVRSDGTIAARYIDPDYRKRMEIKDLLGALDAAAQYGASPG
ncbi:MAG TPA: peroxiredoxin-like family protein [Alphaproteobacteria bacterium]|nr:peroxiredoxin-like family protein [Alphaproteobacteria bacterium]